MSIDVKVDATAVTAKFAAMPEALRAKLKLTVGILAEKLRSHIVQDKLRGQVLNRRTGRLGDSIQYRVDSNGVSVTGLVYSSGDVPYAAIHEFGGKTKAHVIEAKNKKALAFGKSQFIEYLGGNLTSQVIVKKVNHPGSVMPERSYMRSGLADMKDEIVARISDATGDVVK